MVAGVRQLWMAKPSGSKNGRGIKVLADPLADAPRKEGILIQRYVHPPYLVGGLKVSRFLAWIGAACLRECVHGASITRRTWRVASATAAAASASGGGEPPACGSVRRGDIFIAQDGSGVVSLQIELRRHAPAAAALSGWARVHVAAGPEGGVLTLVIEQPLTARAAAPAAEQVRTSRVHAPSRWCGVCGTRCDHDQSRRWHG